MLALLFSPIFFTLKIIFICKIKNNYYNDSMKLSEKKDFLTIIVVIILSSGFGFLAGLFALNYYVYIPQLGETRIIEKTVTEYEPQTTHEERIIQVAEKASLAVVSIVATKDVPKMETYFESPFQEFEEFFGPMPEFQVPRFREGDETEEREIGWGTGFIVSEKGLILTNRHVVADQTADFTVFTVDEKKFSAKVVARDPFFDLAILQIQPDKSVSDQGTVLKPFPVLELGDSEALQPGQTVIAIGNALGEFRNTVSVGVISGLGRTITASGGGTVEVLEDVIQTDAAINRGNSGGPLLNLKGQVIGINTAMAWQAQNIGFALPINNAKRAVEQVKTLGKIVHPFLGIRYVLITDQVQKENNLPVNYGAWISSGDRQPAVEPGSAAQKSGLLKGDIILEFNGEKITVDNSLARVIMKYSPGDRVNLKILRNNQELLVDVILGERS